jgi:hypothetical protein
MPTEQEQTGVYPAAFNIVSAFVWDRFSVRIALPLRAAVHSDERRPPAEGSAPVPVNGPRSATI